MCRCAPVVRPGHKLGLAYVRDVEGAERGEKQIQDMLYKFLEFSEISRATKIIICKK